MKSKLPLPNREHLFLFLHLFPIKHSMLDVQCSMFILFVPLPPSIQRNNNSPPKKKSGTHPDSGIDYSQKFLKFLPE